VAVVAVREIWSGRGYSLDDKLVRTYTRVFRVETNNVLDGPALVRSAPGIPQIGHFYTNAGGTESDPGAFVTRISPEQDQDDPRFWLVRVEYGTVSITSGGKGGNDRVAPNMRNENPLLRGPEIRWGTSKYQEVANQDRQTRAPIVTSAGELFENGVERDQTRMTLSISRNEASFNHAFFSQFFDNVNVDNFFGFGTGEVKCESITGDFQFENNISFWRVNYEFAINKRTWKLRILDQGYKTLDANGKAVEITDGFANRAGSPVLLNGAGKKLLDATTTLSANVNANALSLSVASASTSKFPVTGEGGDFGFWGRTPTFDYILQVDEELMLVQTADALLNTFNIMTRGYDETIPAAHNNGATVRMMPVYLQYDVYDYLPFAELSLP
jgi:hypothetical protein